MVWVVHTAWHNTMLLQAKAVVVTQSARDMTNIAEHVHVGVLLSTRCYVMTVMVVGSSQGCIGATIRTRCKANADMK